MQLTAPQQTISNSTARFRMGIAGRRFGKTVLSIYEIGKYARWPKRKIWYVAPFYGQAKEIAWVMLKDRLREKNWVKNEKSLNESALKANLRNGTVISLKGANNPDSLRGVGVHFMILDEMPFMKKAAWTESLRPMLSDTGGHCLMLGTPKGKNWAYDLFQRGADPAYPNWNTFHYTTLDGGNVPPEEVQEAMDELDERTFRQEYLATFETYDGIIYYQFSREGNVKPYEKPENFQRIPLHIGMDFNINPMCATVSVVNKETLHTFDEIIIYGSNTNEMAQEIRSRYPDHFIYIYPDPACRQQRTSANGNTDLSILQDAKYKLNVRVRNSHALVRDRINAVNSRIKTMSGDIRYFIDPACKTQIKCLENQLYKEGTMTPDKDSGFDHMNDATGYKIEYLWPMSKAEESYLAPMG